MINSFYELCVKYNIEYIPAYKTLLGIERHNGLIPWDDDIDLHINKKDYEKVKNILLPELQNKFNISNIEINTSNNLKFKIFLKDNMKLKKNSNFILAYEKYTWPFIDLLF